MFRIPLTARLTEQQKDMRDPQPKENARKPSFGDRPIGAPVVYEGERIRQLRLQRSTNAWRARQHAANSEPKKVESPESETISP